MATKAQVIELQNKIAHLEWELENKDKDHKSEVDNLKLEHQKEIEELKVDMLPMTRKDVINLIKENLRIQVDGGYNGYVDATLYFGDEVIDSSSDSISCESNPMDE